MTAGNTQPPPAPAVALWALLVASFSNRTTAPGTLAPEESCTVPTICPVVATWAGAGETIAASTPVATTVRSAFERPCMYTSRNAMDFVGSFFHWGLAGVNTVPSLSYSENLFITQGVHRIQAGRMPRWHHASDHGCCGK